MALGCWISKLFDGSIVLLKFISWIALPVIMAAKKDPVRLNEPLLNGYMPYLEPLASLFYAIK